MAAEGTGGVKGLSSGDDKCGTYAGWNQHQRRGEYACYPCKKARSEYARSRRHRNGESKGTWVYVPDPPELTDDHYSI